MSTVKLKCGKCGKTLLRYTQGAAARKYRSPLRRCPGCGEAYLDPRCHELAAEAPPADAFRVSSYLLLSVIGAFILWRGVHLLSWRQMGIPDGLQWLLPAALMLMGAVMVAGGITEVIGIVTGLKAKKFRRLRQESEERLRDKGYARTLAELGMNIPKEYL